MPSDPPTPPRAHLPGLDGVRGALVIGILGYHLGYAPSMFVTVDGFFALSGFLITGLLLGRTPGSMRELRAWWARRVRRLTPAVALTVVGVLVLFAATAGIATDAFATMTWWANWHQILDGSSYWDPEPSPLRHAWTLSIEEQFYLVWPVLLVGAVALARRLGRDPRTAVAALAGTLAAASYGWAAWLAAGGTDLNRIYLGTDTRFGSIALGCAAAALVHGRAIRPSTKLSTGVGFSALAVLVLLGVVLQIREPATYEGGLALAGASATALVVVAARPGPLARMLSATPLRWLGVRSYGVYLWSWPMQILIERTWPDAHRPVVAVATVVASFTLGALSLRFVETPLRGGTGWAAPLLPRRTAWSAGAIVVVIAILGVGATAEPPPAHRAVSEAESADVAIAAALESLESSTTTTVAASTVPPTPVPTTVPATTGATVAPAASTRPPPTLPPEPPPMRVMTAGDSQAYTAAQPTIPRGDLPPYIESVTVAGVLGCGVLVRAPGWTMIDPARGGKVDGGYCLDSAEVAEVTALRAKPDWMVLFSGGFERPFAYEAPDGQVHPARHPRIRAAVVDHLTSRIRRARAAGVRTALVEWTCPGNEVGDEELAGATRWHNAMLREVAASIPGTITIPPNASVCVDGDAAGRPTPEKDRAWGYEVHPVDRSWLWRVQLGPALQANR